MSSKNIFLVTVTLALMLLTIGIKAELYYGSSYANVTQETAMTLSGSSSYTSDTEYQCGKSFFTSTYFSDQSGTYDPLTVSWSAPATLPSSCVGTTMSFQKVVFTVIGSGFSNYSITKTSTTGSHTKSREYLAGEDVDTLVTYYYEP